MPQHGEKRFSLIFCGIAASKGNAQNLSLLKVSKEAAMSFCVAGVALRVILSACLRKCLQVFCAKGTILHSTVHKIFPCAETDLHISLQAQHFEHMHVQFAWQASHFKCVVLQISCVLY